MSLFYLLLCLMLLGFGSIAFIVILDRKKNSPTELPQPTSTTPPTTPKDILNRLGLEHSDSIKTPAKPNPLPELFNKASTTKEPFSTPILIQNSLQNPPKILPPDTKAVSEISLKYDELQNEHKELQDKLSKLEELFVEKSSTLEKSEKSLTNELKNQKEFNKIKDFLEKELKEAKEKAKGLQGEIAAAQTESSTHLKRITILEEKVKKLEVELLSSEAAINDGQAGIQLARKHAAELEEKLRAHENLILEKNQKIEDLVKRLNIQPTSNTLPPEPVLTIPEEAPNSNVLVSPSIISPKQKQPEPIPEPIPEKENIPEPATSEPTPTSTSESLTLPPDIFANPNNINSDKAAPTSSAPNPEAIDSEIKKENTHEKPS